MASDEQPVAAPGAAPAEASASAPAEDRAARLRARVDDAQARADTKSEAVYTRGEFVLADWTALGIPEGNAGMVHGAWALGGFAPDAAVPLRVMKELARQFLARVPDSGQEV